ncbi:unnamed protein product [Peronospora effusa]|nr:unnamed protein product [Peronospora effusa]
MVEVEFIEEKPKYPQYVLVEDTLGHDAYHDPEDHQPTVKTERLRSQKQQHNKIAQSKPTKFRMKAPGNTKSIGPEKAGLASWTDADVTRAYHQRKLNAFLESDPVAKILEIRQLGQLTGPVSTLPRLHSVTDANTALVTLLCEANMVAGRFDPDDLLSLGLDRITKALEHMHRRLSILVVTTPATEHPPLGTPTHMRSNDSQMTLQDITVGPHMYGDAGHPGANQDSSQHRMPSGQREAAPWSPGSSSTGSITMMPLGPTGAALFQARARSAEQEPRGLGTATRGKNENHSDFQPMENQQEKKLEFALPRDEDAGGEGPTYPVDDLQTLFDAAMARFLNERQVPRAQPNGSVAGGRPEAQRTTAHHDQHPGIQIPRGHTMTDVDMESVGSCEFDPDNMDLRGPQSMMANAALGQIPNMVPRIKLSATSDLKEFHGRDQDEDRARSWVSTVKTAFIRDQAPDDERCLIFGGLLTGPAQNWYRQLGLSVRGNWKDLMQEFMIRFCGTGVPVARQYYHAKKRSEETPLDYLYRLNVLGLRAKMKMKDGSPKVQKDRVDHYILTVDDPELADKLTMLRLADVEELEEVLTACQRTKARRGKMLFGSNKFLQKAPALPDRPRDMNRRSIHAVRTPLEDSSSEDSSSDSSENEGDLRRVYLMEKEAGRDPSVRFSKNLPTREADQHRQAVDQLPGPSSATPNTRCAYCGSKKHGDLNCWKRLTCDRCGRKGHPSDRCLFVCRGCGEIHEIGKCQMEEFYNMFRQWYNPAKHAGMFPEKLEKMAN